MSTSPENQQPEKSAGDATGRDLEHEATQSSQGIVSEFVYLLAHNRKWWLAPIIIVLLLVGVLLILGGTGIAPFIYTLF